MESPIYVCVLLAIAFPLIAIALPATLDQCLATCPTNTTCTTVPAAVACPLTCANYTQATRHKASGQCAPVSYTHIKSCVCPSSFAFVDDTLQRCVSKEDCVAIVTKKCKSKSNAEYKCITECTSTCAEPYLDAATCWSPCQPGCYCKSGYLEDTKGNCVRRIDCVKRPTPIIG